ncbi:hypothetical protein PPYC1_07320 [Paenibacillus polymyxa]|uniref:hypothetical protein n=1 Tax=Paenibacillus TaxID=44249 RepID=UPI0008FB9213|nr:MULTISPECIES: hypothetical protein [Paenibacillus]APB70178.1 hypothetical protein PPYC1_07320 [Paenibacillus polymyxa]APB74868.1 hypothetical protein PPYC2_07685 [Paenibacillus polymyxa]
MSKLKLETEVFQVSIYCDIILNLIIKHKILSVNKLLVFSYLIKKERFIPNDIYNGNNTRDIIYKCISVLSGDYDEYCSSIPYIIKAIHLLNIKGQIGLENNQLYCLSEPEKSTDKPIYRESLFIEKAIEESRKLSEKQFMREVMNNV